ncbi:MAG: MBL fold metallo-hydrolase [Treponema sp.]|jgi:phosphoribosyl 1,2-cyclic phosphodiesterase|nr:MBL fold metallo-hydrolase [Treponema sp.]
MFTVRFWGVRGSVPCPGPATVSYGGNTSCIEIRAGERLVIVDMGTGIRSLGDSLMEGDYFKGAVNADIFITHTHWDHIMGFPMFTPLFNRNTKLRIRGPVPAGEDNLEAIINAHFSHRYWPVRQSDMAAKIEYTEISETAVNLGDGLKVSTKVLNHPLLCLGYRFEYQGKSVVTIYDHEFYREKTEAAAVENAKIQSFIENADLVIHDSQYTSAEIKNHLGWGHSSYEEAFNMAVKLKIKKLIFFHHDPNRNDIQLEALEKEYNIQAAQNSIETIIAREGLVIEV